MRARRERAVAHSALTRMRIHLAVAGKWTPTCADLLACALEFTDEQPSWWRRRQIQRVKRRAEKRWTP